MCGRFTDHLSWAEIVHLLTLNDGRDIGRNNPPSYNICPTHDVAFVIADADGSRHVKDGRWWLVPHWSKELTSKWPMFNARSETAASKSAFRAAFKSKRCLIAASGYYEWTKAEDGGKDPHFIHLKQDGEIAPIFFAGLWAHNTALDVTSCTILTAAAHTNIEHIHDRMPIILTPDTWADWLNLETDRDDAAGLLASNLGGDLESYRVGREVNSNRAQGSQLIEPVAL